MTKTLKGQSARSFTTSSTEEFISGRNLFLTQPAQLDPGLVLADLPSVADVVSDFGVKQIPENFFCPCPMCQSGAKLYAIEHGTIVDRSLTAVPPEIADEGTLNVIVGGSVSGVIDFAGDHDSINVFLISGQTYVISLRGTGGTPINDSYLEVFNPSNVSIGHDDDGGNDLYSIFTFTAAATGNFRIDASSFPNPGNPGLGGYTVDVRVRGVDAVGNTNATSVHLDQGTTFGFRETGSGSSGVADVPSPTFSGDLDRYSVDLVAGHFYTFKFAGGSDYETGYYQPQSASNMDTYLLLRNAAGTILAQNDDVGFPDDLSSGIGFFATVTGTYYLDAFAYGGYSGGYAIEFKEVDLAGLDPLDSINWFSADNAHTVDVSGTPTIYVYFAVPGEGFGETADNGVDPIPSHGWSAYEKAAVMSALQEFSKILGINYVETSDSSLAEFRLITTTSAQYGAYFYPQDPAYGTQQGIGAFNIVNRGWNETGADPNPATTTDGLQRGGFAYSVILHEFGHAHGLAHPHDHGGGSDIMPGVTGATGSYGVFDLNQMVYTQMSYNDGWVTHPDGAIVGGDPAGFRSDAGWSATLSAFDIAALQLRYGILNPNATGDTTYTLKDVNNEGTWYECIWDTGGTDTIEYTGATRGAVIDLTAATIDYSPTGGGVMSFVHNLPGETTAQAIKGGFTIAKGVVIENATGGGGNDNLIGNAAANVLTGNGGNDNLIGRAGDDTLHGGGGTDTAYYDGNRADYTITAIITGGQITGFTVKDNNLAAPANSGNPIMVANEGTDTLDGVESIHFANANFALAGTVAVFDGDGALVSMHTTIQAAIDAVTTLNGYTIFASAGTYVENVTVNKDLTIQGANLGNPGTDARDPETIIDGQVKATVSGVTIDGVSIVGDAPGSLGNTGVEVLADDFSLINSVLDGDANTAIITGTVTGLDIGNNLITGYAIGVYVSGGGSTGSIHDNLFQGEGGPASGLGNGVNSESSGVLIQDNTFDGLYSGVLNLFPFGPNPVDLDDYVIGNTLTNNAAERPVQVYPTAASTDITGTDYNEAFNGDIAGLASGTALRFDGQGGNDHIYGFDAGDTLLGGEGDDQIYAQAGNDHLTGGNGNDLLYGEGGTDTAHFAGALTYIDTGLGWLVQSGEGNDILNGVEVAIDGGGQRNRLVGATGYGTLQAALTDAQTGDNVRLASGTYTGMVNYNVGGLTVIAQPGAVQNLTYATIGAFGITILAASGNDTITTGTGNDLILGGGGDDVLNGGAGNDVLYGEGGTDTSSGGLGDDVYIVDSTADVTIENALEGNDAVLTQVSYALTTGASVELLSTTYHMGMTNIDLTGNYLDQTIIGNYGNNVITGGVGTDVLIGLLGNDTYIVNGAGSSVIEDAGAGNDIVYTSVSFVLGATSEVEILSTLSNAGVTAIDLTGSNTAQTVVGNNGINVLDGKGGNDLLAGLGGADTFAFTSALGASNVDTIYDFQHGVDKIALDDAIFTAIGGTLDTGEFLAGAGAVSAADADDRIIYNTTTGALYYDHDGLGGDAAVQFATLTGTPVLTFGDFQMI